MFPREPTYYTVWFDAVLYMRRQLPFSDANDVFHIQLWLSDDQVLLIGGPWGEDPREVLLLDQEKSFIARPGEASPWFQIASAIGREAVIDPRLVYGAISLLKGPSSYGYPKYQFAGEDRIAGRPAWKITELDDQMAPIVELSVDKETGFILKFDRKQDRVLDRETRAYAPEEVKILAVEYNVDFPQELFNPRLPWRGGYAWNHTGVPQRPVEIP